MSNSLRPHGPQPTRLFCPWNFSGKSTGVGCHTLLQEIFPNPEIKPESPALQMDSLPLAPSRKPQINKHMLLKNPIKKWSEQLWRMKWQPTAIFLWGKFHGQRSLVGYSPWDCIPVDTTERLTLLLPENFIPHATTKTWHNQINNKHTINGQKSQTDISPNKTVQMTKKHMKRHSTSLIAKEMQV